MRDDTSPPPERLRPPLWRRLVAVVIVLGVFGAAALMLGDYLRVREEVSEGVARRMTLSRPPATQSFVSADRPGLRSWMPGNIAWRGVRELPFGADRAWFVAGSGSAHPKEVFGAVMRSWQPLKPIGARAVDELMEITAAGLLRMNVSVGHLHGVAFLSRVPPDLEAFGEGRFAFEPGGTMLAFPRNETTWEYVTWVFPDGLDLGAFMKQFGAPTGVLDRVAQGVEKHLQPALAIGMDPEPAAGARALPAGTVYCRAVGTGAQALRGAGEAFARAGWRTIREEVSPSGEEVRILAHAAGGRSVWLATSQREQEGGFVTVMLGVP